MGIQNLARNVIGAERPARRQSPAGRQLRLPDPGQPPRRAKVEVQAQMKTAPEVFKPPGPCPLRKWRTARTEVCTSSRTIPDRRNTRNLRVGRSSALIVPLWRNCLVLTSSSLFTPRPYRPQGGEICQCDQPKCKRKIPEFFRLHCRGLVVGTWSGVTSPTRRSPKIARYLSHLAWGLYQSRSLSFSPSVTWSPA